jgi:class 3 adenylate cyclase
VVWKRILRAIDEMGNTTPGADQAIRAVGDFFGSVVNKAARIAAAARPGQILVSDAARAMVSGGNEFDFGPTIRMRIRGIDGESDISPLRWQNDGEAAHD